MFGITDLTTYIIGTIFIILLPGPNSLYVLSVAAKRGVRAGYQGAAAVVVGDTVLMVLAAAGVGTLLAAYPSVFTIIKYAGGAYLAWVGAQLIRGAINRWQHGADTTDVGPEITPQDASHPFKRALVISIAYLSALILMGARVADTIRRRHRLTAAMTGGVGTLFVGFGAKLATATID